MDALCGVPYTLPLWQHVAIIGVEFCDSIGIAYVVIVKVTGDLNQV